MFWLKLEQIERKLKNHRFHSIRSNFKTSSSTSHFGFVKGVRRLDINGSDEISSP